MICPKCEEARLEKVIFKVDGEEALHCNGCDTLWFEGEVVSPTTGHAISGFRDNDKEYTLEKNEEEDSDDEEVAYSKFT